MNKTILLKWSEDELKQYAELLGITVKDGDPKRKLVDAIIARENRSIEGATHGFDWTVSAKSISTVAKATRVGDIDLETPQGVVEYGKILLGDEQFAKLAKAMGDDMYAVTFCISDIDKAVSEGNSLGSAAVSQKDTQS